MSAMWQLPMLAVSFTRIVATVRQRIPKNTLCLEDPGRMVSVSISKSACINLFVYNLHMYA